MQLEGVGTLLLEGALVGDRVQYPGDDRASGSPDTIKKLKKGKASGIGGSD